MEFKEFPKIPRLTRECIITEKIDGTNASVYIPEEIDRLQGDFQGVDLPFLVGSRTRWITPEQDNHGFARWAYANADELLKLGPGHHFGEWWGAGIQRGYMLPKGEKRFSLFNTTRWEANHPACCHVVPVLYRGLFTTEKVGHTLQRLLVEGSAAQPGFMNPEGVVIYHVAGNLLFKKTLEKDDEWKGARAF